MAKHRDKRNSDLDDDEADDRQERRSASRRRRSPLGWLVSRLVVVLVLLAALAFFAPILIVATGLWKSILARAAPQLAGKVDASSLTLSWFSPVEIRGLVVRDPAGQTLAEVPRIASRKSLWQLALNSGDLGVFDVEQPKAMMVLRADGSNVEDLLASLPKTESKASPPQFGLALVRGVVLIDDQVGKRQWLLDGINLDFDWPAATDQSKTGKLAAVLKQGNDGAGPAAGQLAAEFSWQPGAEPSAAMGAGQAQATVQNLPLELAAPALRRLGADIRADGPLSLAAGASWADGGKSMRISLTNLTAPALVISAPKYLSADQPTLSITSGKADVQLAGGRITVQGLQLDSNFLHVEGKGGAPITAVSSPAQPALTAEASDLELTGEFNLAEAARQLPGTLRLRAGTQVTSGKVQFSLASRNEAAGRAWEGDLRTANLVATTAGRPVRFEQPVNVGFLIRQGAKGAEIERLIGRASFMDLEGRGTLSEGSVTAKANLNRLVTDLSQLIDWGNTRLAGGVEARLRWNRDQNARWTANADADVRDFELTASGLTPWKEPNLHVGAEVRGIVQNDALTQIDAAKATVDAGADRLVAELVEPVKSPGAAATWPIKFSLQGDLATWTPRLQPFVPLGNLRMAGAIDAAGSGRFSQQASEVGPTVIQITQLAVEGPGLSIREPVVKVETAAAWDQAKSTLTLGSSTFASSALALRADGVRLTLGKEPSAVGIVDLRGDLGRLSAWQRSETPPTSRIAGALTGHLEIGYRGQSLEANWTSDVENLTCFVAALPAPAGAQTIPGALPAASEWQAVWHDPRVNFVGKGTYDPVAGLFKLERTSVTAESVNLSASGMIAKLTSSPEVDLAGEVAYDLGLITQQIQTQAQRQSRPGAAKLPYGLATLELAGKEKRQFVLKGPLFAAATNLTPPGAAGGGAAIAGYKISPALAGEASLGWAGAKYVGLVAGPANVRARLAGGVVQVGPLDIPLAEGRLTTAAQALLNDIEPAVVVGRGPLLENVRISPEMCSLWLKFVAPLVADATRAEGKFSLSLEGADVPLPDPQNGTAGPPLPARSPRVAGTLSIQNGQIGPGPLAQQYLGVAQQLRGLFDRAAGSAIAAEGSQGWLILPQQEVPFELKDKKVFHRGFTMSVRDVVVTTEGSVGLENQELNLVCTIPVQDSWFREGRGALLKGKTIPIPITGTLTRPQIDKKILETLGKQLVGSAIEGFFQGRGERGQEAPPTGQGILERGIGQGLDRLFGPRQPATPPPAPMP